VSGSARISGGLSIDAGKITGDGSGCPTVFTNVSVGVTNFTGNLSGDVTGTQSATVVAGSAVCPRSMSPAGQRRERRHQSRHSGTIVSRDGSGSFSASTITPRYSSATAAV